MLVSLTKQRSLRILHDRESGSDRWCFRSEWIIEPGANMYHFGTPSDHSYLSDSSNESEDESEGKICDGTRHKPLRISEGQYMTEAFLNFAQGAFGKNDFPSLQLLVCGICLTGDGSIGSTACSCVATRLMKELQKAFKKLQTCSEPPSPIWRLLQACPGDLLFNY